MASVNVVELIVAAFIASENVASTFVPVDTPIASSIGTTAVTLGAVTSTVHERLAGLGSVFPAESVARTWKLFAPSARPL